MTLELSNQTKTENLLSGFQLEKMDKKQWLKNLEPQHDLIESFFPVAKSKSPDTNNCKRALSSCKDKRSAYIYTSLELTSFWSKH